jgi:hypothetical protein
MKQIFNLFSIVLITILVSCGESNTNSNNNSTSPTNNQSPSQNPSVNNENEGDNQKEAAKQNLTWGQLYPILKKNLMGTTCEPCKVTEENENSLTVNSRESDFILSYWSFDKNTLKIADIDGDGLVDYTIEMLDEGAGCGGNLGFYERWTLFGSKPTIFINTHVTTIDSGNEKWVPVN